MKTSTILLLHGWGLGMSKEKYQPLIDELKNDFNVVSVDFPGFGQTDLPDKAWTVGDYANWLASYLKENKIGPNIIVGHSFGGRVAIKAMANKLINTEKLILVASAGVERKSLKVKILIFLTKLIPKKMRSFLNFGSKDFRESSGVMRETMKLVVGESLENDMSKIVIPTLLIWGSEDKTTPLWQARIINKLISNSELKIINGANHGVPYRNPVEVAELIIKWLK